MDVDAYYDGPECIHCHTRPIYVRRRNKDGDLLRNACAVYARIRGQPWFVPPKRNKIWPRSKYPFQNFRTFNQVVAIAILFDTCTKQIIILFFFIPPDI